MDIILTTLDVIISLKKRNKKKKKNKKNYMGWRDKDKGFFILKNNLTWSKFF